MIYLNKKYLFRNLIEGFENGFVVKIAIPLLIVLGLFLPIRVCAQTRPKRPNIIIIIADDMGWSDIGYNGSGIRTPNIDRLAQTGIKLNFQYVAPTCTPTRVGTFTGKYPSRFGVTGPDYGEVIPLETPTMASLLKAKGYFTALVGKWHMGSPPKYIPINYGFMSAYGYFAGQIDPYTHRYKKNAPPNRLRKTWYSAGAYLKYLAKKRGKKYKKTEKEELYGFRYLHQKGHITDLLTGQAIHIIKDKSKKPFFIYLAYSVPHYPLNEPEEWLSMYENTFAYSSRRRFAASVSHMDAGIGRIMEALQKTDQRDNTLILFTSDNGGQKIWSESAREVQYKGRYTNVPHNVLGNNFPLRGWKGTLYEGGIRVPAFINWPGHLSPGVLNVPTKYTDWLPTFLGLTGSSQEDIQKSNFDGRNLWPLLTGKGKKSDFENRTIFWEIPQGYAIRKGPWKLIVYKKSGKAELYNINTDFRELHDLSGEKPKKVKKLKELLKKFW